jgi:hypothetical protein
VTEALDELRKPEGDYRALVISPALSEQEVIDAIASVRQHESAVTILPVVLDRNQSSTVVAAGASDFLVFTGGTLVDPSETIARATSAEQGPVGQPASGVVGVAKKPSGIRNLFAAIRRGKSELSEQEEADRQRLEARLNQIRDTAEQLERQPVITPTPPAEKSQMASSAPEAPRAQEPTARKRRATDTFTRAELDIALNSSRLELAKVVEEHKFARAAWERTFQELQSQLNGLKADAESRAITLDTEPRESGAVTSDHRAEFDITLAAERAAAAETQTILEAELAEAKAEQQKASETLVSERTAWNMNRQQLEAALRHAQAELKQAADKQTEVTEREQVLKGSAEAQATLEKSLARAQAEKQKAVEVLAGERAESNSTRQRLEAAVAAAQAELSQAASRQAADLVARTKEQRESAAARAKLEAALAEAQAQKHKASEAFDAERATWNETRQEFDAAIQQARTKLTAAEKRAADLDVRTKELRESAGTRATLEAALTEAQIDRQKTADAIAAERAAWTATRQQLETAVGTLKADMKKAASLHAAELMAKTKELQESSSARAALETAVKKADAERRAAEGKHAADAAAWDAERRQLETRVAELKTAGREEVGAAMMGARDELAKAAETYNAERTGWQVAHQQLEARVNELQGAAEARDKLEAALAAARAELQETIDIHAAERAIWEASRQLRETSPHDGTMASAARGDGREPGDDSSAKDPELLDAYRALEARLRETTNRLHLVRRPGFDGAEGQASDERARARGVEEVARLATAITPDVTDLVSSIEEFGTQLSQELGSATAEQSRAAAILQRSREAGDLLRQLLAFIEKQAQPIVAMDLTEAVQKAEHMLAWLVGAHIEFRTVLGPPAVVNVQSDDFQRLLTALVSTARDLLTAGGSVVVETSLKRFGDRPDQISGGSKNNFPALTVTASGYGVRRARTSAALDLVVRECGGIVSMGTSPNGGSTLEVVFGLPQSAADVNRRTDSDALPLQSAG